jgi:heat shock protein HtpX
MEKISFEDAAAANRRNSILLVATIFFILFAILYTLSLFWSYIVTGWIETNVIFIITIFVLSLVLVLISALPVYYKGHILVLKDADARPAHPKKHIYLINTVEGLALAAGLSVPKIYIIPHSDINAFATGRDPDHACIAVTEGALTKLNRAELEGVIGHEMAHIKNFDIRFFLMVGVFVGLVAILSHFLLNCIRYGKIRLKGQAVLLLIVALILAIFAPIITRLVQLAISRQREFLADAGAVELTRNPAGLIGALKKIKANSHTIPVDESISHFFIDDPRNTFIDNIWETHPPIEERIKRLEAM